MIDPLVIVFGLGVLGYVLGCTALFSGGCGGSDGWPPQATAR